MEDFHKSPFGKMFMELLARHRGKTSKPSSKPSGKYAGGGDCVPRFKEDKSGRQRWPKTGFILGDHSSIAWRGLDAQFWGVPHRRKRVFLVFDLGGQCAAEILFKRKGLQRDFKKIGRKRDTLRPSAETSLMEHDCVFSVDNHAQDKRVRLRRDGVVQTLAGRMGTGGGNVPMIVAKVHEKICFSQSSYSDFSLDSSSSCLKASGGSYGGGSETLVAIPYTLKIRGGCKGGGKGALIQKDKSATLSCNNDQSLFVPMNIGGGKTIYLVRRLTPTECASLQGFDKDWCALVPHSDSAEYKMWGNGMALPCMLYIMEGVQEILSRRFLSNLFDGKGDGGEI